MPRYVFEVETNFEWKTKTDGSVKVNEFTVIAKTVIEACEKVNKLLPALDEDVKYNDVVSVIRIEKVDA